MRSRRFFLLTSLNFLIISLLVLSGQAIAFDYWPDTGQEKCYNNTVEIPCPGSGEFSGQDAQYKGLPKIYTKLDNNGNDLPDSAYSWVMVRDELTGLIWEVKTADNRDVVYTWANTASHINTLNNARLGGADDWRMPTIRELSSLSHAGKSDPAVDTNYFPRTVADYYWSATPDHAVGNMAWFVNFKLGNVYRNNDGVTKNSSLYIRAVRGGRGDFGGTRYTDNGTTITDNATGLEWQKDSDATPRTWQEALNYCETLPLAGGNWRLPDRNELQTLIDYSGDSPATAAPFPANDFPDPTSASYYWSSSSNNFSSSNNHAWYIWFQYGEVYSSDKSGPGMPPNMLVRAVRGQQTGPAVTLHLSVDGPGSVSSHPAGIDNCTKECTATLHYGDVLTAQPESSAKFIGWSGIGCSGNSETCTVTAREGIENKVTAKFAAFPWPAFIPATTGAGHH